MFPSFDTGKSFQRLKNGLLLVALVVPSLAGSCAGGAPIFVIPSESSARTSPQSGSEQETTFKASFRNGKITVDVYPLAGEGYIDMAVRISNQPKQWRKLKKWNRNRRFPKTGITIPVPLTFLKPHLRMQAVEALFPDDKFTSAGWQHRVTFRGETMWFIAETFTGDGVNHPALAKANNRRKGQAISIGDVITIPHTLLSDEFSRDLPQHPDLAFERGEDGKLYAVYRLKRGEAIYSAVVVRFTGRVDGNEVNQMARTILELNGLSDPRRIPAGKKIRIPFEYLSDDFATGGAPDRVVKVERKGRGTRRHVIIDPGHGGSDPGTTKRGLSEDELAYDVALRLKKRLEKEGATVYLTVDDTQKNGPQNSASLSNGKSERLATTPPYLIRDTRVSVNLRVYLVNAIYERLLKRGVDPANIYMVSIHMDHLHPSMHGAMIYYPNANERKSRFRASGRIYNRYAESRHKTLTFSARENRKAESYSYDLSRRIVRSFSRSKVPVHSYRPIRPFVYRKNRKWTPAIIRYSKVPSSVLVEVINMANSKDLANIKNHRFRERVARALAEAIL